MLSCHEKISSETRKHFRNTLVVHASDLPQGKGWSPHIWQILEGKNEIKVTLLEAADEIDAGDIWIQKTMLLQGNELYDEINLLLFTVTLELIEQAIVDEKSILPKKQLILGKVTTYPRRKPDDSKIDPEKSIASQFNLFRVADPERYPNFFDWRGQKYSVVVKKIK